MFARRFNPALLRCVLLAFLASTTLAARAQNVGSYRFLASESVYTPLTGGTQLFTPGTDDALSEPISLGFPFLFAGQTYGHVQVSSNGFVHFGADAADTGFENRLESTGLGPVLAPLWDDLSVGTGGQVQYRVTGQAPDRVFEVEFSNMRWDLYNDPGEANFQVCLFEAGSEIVFAYGTLGTSNNMSGGASIGLSNATEDSTYFLSVIPAHPVVISTREARNDLSETAFLPSGTTYRFMPPLEKDLEVRSMDTPLPSRFPGQYFRPRVTFRNTSLTDYDSVQVRYEVLRKNRVVYENTGTLADFSAGEIERLAFDSTALPAGHYTTRTSTLLAGDQYALNDTLTGALIINWGVGSEMRTSRRSHTATTLPDGRVLAVGGTNWTVLAEAEIYDPVTRSWHQAASMKTARMDHAAILLNDGRVLVTGGRIDDPLYTAEIYDPATDTWKATRLMAHARHSHTASLLPDGRVLVVGGFASAGSSVRNADPIQRSEIYDPSTDTWTAAADLPDYRAGHTAITLEDGEVLIAGGSGHQATACYAFDPRSEEWSPAGSLQQNRLFGKSVRLSNEKVMITGGNYNNGFSVVALNSVEIYDARINHWRNLTPMQEHRQSHTASLLQDGKVLVAGGSARSSLTPNQAHTRSEIYDPETGTWTYAGDLEEGRLSHTASILPDGSVLVTGGFGAARLSSAERYNYPAVLASTPVEPRPALPESIVLHPNYPNPFNPTTTITYTLARPAEVTLTIFDLLGRRVRTLVDTRQAAGSHELRFEGIELPSGVYLYRLQAGEQVQTRKMLLVK